MNTPVSFELAKLLKETGFDGETKSAFYTDGTKAYCDPTLVSGMGNTQGFMWWNRILDYYAMPTIAEVVMWLYEKHGVWIGVILSCTWGYALYNFSRERIHDDALFKSPTEAYEAAIKYTLENIIK